VLWHASDRTSAAEWEAVQAAATSLGLQLVPLPVQDAGELEAAVATVARYSDGLDVLGSASTNNERARLVQLAAQHRLPTIYAFAESARAGGLMSYGTNLAGMFRRAATHMDKVLQGTRPADVPVEQPTTFDFVLNLKTARALGVTVPQALLAQATEILE
jgi:putative ABC transport system substrate-binding protein